MCSFTDLLHSQTKIIPQFPVWPPCTSQYCVVRRITRYGAAVSHCVLIRLVSKSYRVFHTALDTCRWIHPSCLLFLETRVQKNGISFWRTVHSAALEHWRRHFHQTRYGTHSRKGAMMNLRSEERWEAGEQHCRGLQWNSCLIYVTKNIEIFVSGKWKAEYFII